MAITEEALAQELTSRERRILPLVVCGMTNKEIASELGIAEYTARFHVVNILHKFKIESRHDIRNMIDRSELMRFVVSKHQAAQEIARLRKHIAFVELVISAYQSLL